MAGKTSKPHWTSKSTSVRLTVATPHQRTNQRTATWLPKGTDININPTHLSVIENNLNTMPRKHGNQPKPSIFNGMTCNHH